MFCEVYLFDIPYHLDRPFDYECTPEATAGRIVKVPFGKSNSLRVGIVLKVKEKSDSEGIKPVHSVISEISLTEEMLGLCLFMKEYTLCSFGEAARAILPPGALSESQSVRYKRSFSLAIDRSKAEELLRATGRGGIRSEGQRIIIKKLLEVKEIDEELLREEVGVSSANIRALVEKGVIGFSEREHLRNPYKEYSKVRDTAPITLSDEQTGAYSKIKELYEIDEPRAALLFGVTGSGKTNVIMRAIDRVLEDGKNVIMLVPEISLTPQTVGLFCRRYGERVAVIHSSLSQGERLDAYRRIKRDEVDLVIGTRSAVFAPLENIGMIVIDEEHEHTYKSESNPKYHARDIAAYRCKKHNSLMLLASATPSIESFYKAKQGIYTLITLRQRYGGYGLPRAVIVDMREELRLGNTSPISDRLLNEMNALYEKGEQAILFLNRRGYSSQISCKSCGEVITCPRCSVSLTYHTDGSGGRLLCHLCGYSVRTPRSCPACNKESLSFLGFGTQKLEGEVEKYLPDMTVMRMDADTTGAKLSYDRMLEDFREGRADVLLGTQMVAKGHDFPKVRLVGVALADTSLFVSDFRAQERTFSLLTQVIGRAGRRGGGGVAVIQTFAPDNEIIKLACKQDYEKFYEGEIAIRRELSYPPFCDMVQLTVTSDREKELFGSAERLSDMMKKKLEGEYSGLPFVAFGPFEAQVYKLNEKYRMRMVVKCRLNRTSRKLFHELLCEFSHDRSTTLAVDLNPLSI